MQSLDMAGAANRELWTTDLFMPEYRPGQVGCWRIFAGGGLIHDWGYFTGPCLAQKLPLLARRVKSEHDPAVEEWQTWMALTPHEIESQELGCRHAFGHTVVMGLGMGWTAANVALNPNVAQVTVVELDRNVIDLFHQSGALDSVPAAVRKRIRVVHANATDWRPELGGTVDFVHVDIWRRLGEAGTTDQVRRMQANVQAETIYYWGQELAIHAAARRLQADESPLTADSVRAALDRVLELPLLVPADRDYPQLIEQVIRNRIQRRLPH
ncbi:MAG: hypothetical protein JXR37_27425 [Kiritimatiellae bacterium]|nr:hypothetical protein [Kiritimatiellia bacterium]